MVDTEDSDCAGSSLFCRDPTSSGFRSDDCFPKDAGTGNPHPCPFIILPLRCFASLIHYFVHFNKALYHCYWIPPCMGPHYFETTLSTELFLHSHEGFWRSYGLRASNRKKGFAKVWFPRFFAVSLSLAEDGDLGFFSSTLQTHTNSFSNT